MVYRCYNYPDYLMHHGIKGQKWGIRRTPAQLGHVVSSGARKIKNAVTSASAKRKAKKQAKKDAEEQEEKKRQEQDLETRKNNILKSRSARQLYENADLFTTQELQSAYNRLVLERNISQLTPKEKSTGQKVVDFYINNGEKVSKVIGTTNKIIANSKRFAELTGLSDSKTKDKGKQSDGQNGSSKKKKDKGGDSVAGEARKVASEAARDFAKDFSDIGDFARKAAKQASSSSSSKKEPVVNLSPDDVIVRDLSNEGRRWLEDRERRRLPGR